MDNCEIACLHYFGHVGLCSAISALSTSGLRGPHRHNVWVGEGRVDAAKANTKTAYRALTERLEQQPELKSLWFGKELFAANPNFVIYHLQVDLKRKGIYTGTLNALATRLTLRALNHECMTLKDTSRCGHAPLHPDVIGALLAR